MLLRHDELDRDRAEGGRREEWHCGLMEDLAGMDQVGRCH